MVNVQVVLDPGASELILLGEYQGFQVLLG